MYTIPRETTNQHLKAIEETELKGAIKNPNAKLDALTRLRRFRSSLLMDLRLPLFAAYAGVQHIGVGRI